MTNILEYMGMAILSPRQAMRVSTNEGRSIIIGLAIVLLFSISTSASYLGVLMGKFFLLISIIMSSGETGGFSFLSENSSAALTIGVVVMTISSLVLWLIASIVVHGIAKIMGGAGRIQDTIAFIGFSWISWSAMIIAGLIAVPLGFLQSINILLVGAIATIIWQAALMVIGIQEAHGFTLFKAILVVLLSLVLAFLFFMTLPSIPLTLSPGWWQ